jgi:acyl dehydratase
MTKSPLYLEDIHVGMGWARPAFTVSAEEIVVFGKSYDPQPFHTDPVLAAAGPFGGLIASGWHLAALAMRQIVEAQPFGSSPIVGLGVAELRWFKPVRPGDQLHVKGEVTDIRPSQSKPDRGVVRSAITLLNHRNEIVMSFLTDTQLPTKAKDGT